MKLSKDKTQIIYNDFLTLAGIPPKAFEYRLSDRFVLDWIIDQYRVKTDKSFDKLRTGSATLLMIRTVATIPNTSCG